VSRVGDDADGHHIITTASEFGVDVSLVEVDPNLPTGITAITIEGEQPRFDVRQPAAWDLVVGPDPIPPHDALVFGSLPLRHPTGAATLWRLVEGSSGFIALDANLRPPWVDIAEIARLVTRIDLLKMNFEEEALLAHPSGPEWVCVTRGATGATLRHRDGREWMAAGVATRVVDTVGAGDAFLAVLLDGLFRGSEPLAALEEANRLAATTIARQGGLPGPHPSRPDAP
jgi:fructokinase